MQTVCGDDNDTCLCDVIDNILLTTATMISDFHFDTRCGDFMMERFDNYLYEIRDYAKKENISCEFKDYESNEYFVEWITLSKEKNSEVRLQYAINLLKIVLAQISCELDEYPEKHTKLCPNMCANILLLHTIMGTLDLHYNTIDKIMDVMTNRQIKLLVVQKSLLLP